MGNETNTLPVYVSIWLTLISGAILLKATQDYWSVLSKRIRRLDLSALLEKAQRAGFSPIIPTWMNAFAAFAYISIFALIIIVGTKIAVASELDRLLRIQVLLALSYLVGRFGSKFIHAADDRLQPFQSIYLLPMSISILLLAFMFFMMVDRCPQNLAENWWMPCISLKAEPVATEV